MTIMILAQTDGSTALTIPLMTVANKVILKTDPCAIHFLGDKFHSPVFR
jgi:hypothetical protein